MCQLLGMNCNVPTDICFSFEGFCERGGATDEHRDGWGIAFFEDKGCRSFLDPHPSVDSVVSTLVKGYPIKSCNVIAHIRKATFGEVSLENTHPFTRELWGRYWVFAHNGDLKDFDPVLRGDYLPVGATDSERAFCLILERLKQRFSEQPDVGLLSEALQTVADEIADYGIFNFLLSNGEHLFAHCTTKLHYLVRQHPFSAAQLKDKDIQLDFSEVTTPDDRVAVIATEPLTVNETWVSFPKNRVLVFQDGDIAT
jgi:glutamine amidotransferase